MDLNIAGLRVLVTAGASGIGREIARAFAREGAKVHICDIDPDGLDALAVEDPAFTRSICDVSDRAQVRRVMDEALDALGGLDALVNNAGIAGPTGRIEDIHPEDWDRTIEVCLTSQFNFTRLAIPHLKASANASIVNLSSVAGRLGFAMRTPYAAAKWGVIGLTKSLAIELGEFGIRANAILPGVVEGDRIRRVFESKAQARGMSFAQVEEQALASVSMHTMVTPAQIADQIVFLCSERGRTISGQSISICGDVRMLV